MRGASCIFTQRVLRLSCEKIQKQRILNVHSIFRLIKDHAVWTINDSVHHFMAAVSGKAMHEIRV
jgi:hypothetical protein